MKELLRDSCFGQIVRLVTRNKVFRYPEEDDPEHWKKYLNEEKSGYAAHHGTTQPEEKSDEEKDGKQSDSETDTPDEQPLGGYRTREANGTQLPSNSRTSSRTEMDSQERARYNAASGRKIDQEKGKDVHIVDWYGKDDPANPQNWSTGKKFFVTFEICLLTFGVYIGSAIYTPGIMEVEGIFHVSQAAATLGLTMFVLGYGIGKQAGNSHYVAIDADSVRSPPMGSDE